jgi:hypothetical protein
VADDRHGDSNILPDNKNTIALRMTQEQIRGKSMKTRRTSSLRLGDIVAPLSHAKASRPDCRTLVLHHVPHPCAARPRP